MTTITKEFKMTAKITVYTWQIEVEGRLLASGSSNDRDTAVSDMNFMFTSLVRGCEQSGGNNEHV